MKLLLLTLTLALQTYLSNAQDTNTELFLEIPERGRYTVSVNEDIVASDKPRFRFYSIETTNPSISILQNGKQILKTRVRLTANNRTIFIFTKNKGLVELKTLPLFLNKKYALDDWDGTISTLPDRSSRPGRLPETNLMSDATYQSLVSLVKKEGFDNTKVKIIKTSLLNSSASTAQLMGLLKTLDFENNRLDLAKYAFDYVADKQNFFKVTEAFDFSSSKDQLMDYINKKSGR